MDKHDFKTVYKFIIDEMTSRIDDLVPRQINTTQEPTECTRLFRAKMDILADLSDIPNNQYTKDVSRIFAYIDRNEKVFRPYLNHAEFARKLQRPIDYCNDIDGVYTSFELEWIIGYMIGDFIGDIRDSSIVVENTSMKFVLYLTEYELSEEDYRKLMDSEMMRKMREIPLAICKVLSDKISKQLEILSNITIGE